MKLGTWPKDKYEYSWMTQRLMNYAPSWALARRSPVSVSQQVVNPIGLEIQRVHQQLTEERFNSFLSSADIGLMDNIYRLDLGNSIDFNYTETSDGRREYEVPRVYVNINDTEHEITIAKYNDIDSFWYTAIPSRIEYGELSETYTSVIPETSVSSLVSVSPNPIAVEGHLYITIKDNSNWSYRAPNKIYFSKIYIKGETRKGTKQTEAVPLRYNGTFKTVNQWKEVEEIFVSYLSEDATITVECLPFSAESFQSTNNIIVPNEGAERFRFEKLEESSWGSKFVIEGFATGDMDIVRLGHNAKDPFFEFELLDELNSNINAISFTKKTNSDQIYLVDSSKFYVYDTRIPYPNMQSLTGDSMDPKVDIYVDRWFVSRDQTVKISTRILDAVNVPYQSRWTVIDPNGDEYYMGLDGSLWPATTDAWIVNDLYAQADWDEKVIEFVLSERGTYIIKLETAHLNSVDNTSYILASTSLIHAGSLTPEIELDLPIELQNPDNIAIDSDGYTWIEKYGIVYKLDVFHDYFLSDYEGKKIWLRENYKSARVTV